ncbi:hypothetical protein Tco_1341520, partial [Tanacetum coccineum]
MEMEDVYPDDFKLALSKALSSILQVSFEINGPFYYGSKEFALSRPCKLLQTDFALLEGVRRLKCEPWSGKHYAGRCCCSRNLGQ